MQQNDLPEDYELDFRAIRYRFAKLNQARLERVHTTLYGRQHDVIHVLPLLFHVNHALMPGYVSREVPAGIAQYDPGRRELEVGKRLARSFEYREPWQREHPLLALYMLGSPGSVAYSRESDFDIWVCHAPDLGEAELRLLRQKADRIERWAAEFALEIHFFLVNVEHFREGRIEPMSSVSSGTAQRNLLLEEFYRSSILLAGQAPLWWVVPPAHEFEYDRYAHKLKEMRFPHARDLLDFGGLSEMPVDEFFGASLWHLYKSIDSPYKSILKLLLIESYAHDHPRMDLACQRLKRAIYRHEDTPDKLDSYLLMMNKVEEYLQQLEDRERLSFARRAFYFKTGMRMSAEVPGHLQWKQELLLGIFKKWDWHPLDVKILDSRASWKAAQAAEERHVVFEVLNSSYRFLSDFARREAALSLISEDDLTLLGRKLYAAFERKPGKIELFNRGIHADLHETVVTVTEQLDEQQQSSWQMYSESVGPEELAANTPLKRARSLLELLAWAYFNGIVDRHSVVVLQTRITQLGTSDLKRMLEHMHAVFPPSCLESRSQNEFTVPARIANCALYVNNEVDAFSSLGMGKTVSSQKTDALSYGGQGKNLVQSMSLVIVTSWREVLTFHYRRGRGLMDFFREYFKWSPPSQGVPPPPIQAFGISAQRGQLAAQRIAGLYQSLVATWYGNDAVPDASYVLAVGHGFYMLEFRNDLLHYEAFPGKKELLAALSRPREGFHPVVFDPCALDASVLPQIYARNRAGWIQFFYLTDRESVEIYILDERGSLHHEHMPFFDADVLLNQFSRFFAAVRNRTAFLMQDGRQTRAAKGVEYFQIMREGGGYRFGSKQAHSQAAYQHYFSLQVVAEDDGFGEPQFTLFCDDREFSTLEYGRDLFAAVIRHVLALRSGQQPYPVHITDVAVPCALLGEPDAGKIQTIHFLRYKQRIEREMNRVLQADH